MTMEEKLKTAKGELEQLSRVSHRVAMTDSTQLEKVLNLLLPRLLSRIGSNNRNLKSLNDNDDDNDNDSAAAAAAGNNNDKELCGVVKSYHEKIHGKLVEMLSHIIKRVRDDASCKLPCLAVLSLLLPSTSTSSESSSCLESIDPFTINLSLTFLTIGIPRSSNNNKSNNNSNNNNNEFQDLLPGLLTLLASHTHLQSLSKSSSKNQAFQIAHLTLRTLEGIALGRGTSNTNGNGNSNSNSNSSNNRLAGTKRQSSTLKKDDNQKNQTKSTTTSTGIDKARILCQSNPTISSALYDLLLDVLLYQSNGSNINTNNSTTSSNTITITSSNLPPPGLSTISRDRLTSGYSTIEQNWVAEYATKGRLKEFKIRILNLIAPCRQWDLFNAARKETMTVVGKEETQDTEHDDDDHDDNDDACHQDQYDLGVARAVALMVVSSGDQHSDVATKASSYLKAHMDSLRNNKTKSNSLSSRTPSSTTTPSSSTSTLALINNDNQRISDSFSKTLLGHPITLASTLLRLVQGDIISDNTISKSILSKSESKSSSSSSSSNEGMNFQTSLGLFQNNVYGDNKNDKNTINNNNHDHDHDHRDIDNSVIISTKRRMVSEKCITAILTFVASRILDDIPKIFTYSPHYTQSHPQSQQQHAMMNGACIIGSLVLSITKKCTGSGRSLSGSSLTSSVGNSSVAAARLLNSTCMRLVPFYDTCTKIKMTTILNHTNNINDIDMNDDTTSLNRMEHILAQCFAASCSIVKIASSAHSGNVTNSIGVEARDAAYQVISTISRCQLLPNVEFLFNCGDDSNIVSSSSSTSFLSTNTAAMLFGCLVNETETLKPRAIAALDSLLATYCRLLENEHEQEHGQISTSNLTPDKMEDVISTETVEINPWMVQQEDTPMSDNTNSESKYDFNHLSKALQPLLWNAAQPIQPKASRHAAARWAFNLLKPLDMDSACHILCFVSGDKDVISAGVAKEGLGLASQMGEDEVLLITSHHGEEVITPDFTEFVDIVFSSNDVDMTSWRPKYWDFSPRGQGVALRYGSICLLSDLYGGDEGAIGVYLSRIGETLDTYCLSNRPNRQDRDSIELLDEASICLACCLKASQFARQKTVGTTSIISHEKIAELAVTVASSKARRHLASALGYLLEDISIWDCFENGAISGKKWVQHSKVEEMIKNCAEKLNSLSTNFAVVSEIHGAAFLGSSCIRALRLLEIGDQEKSEDLNNCLKVGSLILSALGNGLLHTDEVIGNACSNGLAIALSCNNQKDALVLHELLCEGTSEALRLACMALKKFGHGDHTDASRASLLSKASGVVLAATTVRMTPTTGNKTHKIGSSRLECVEALFALLGSNSYRKDPEMMLIVGEALASYADAYSPEGAKWTWPAQSKPDNYESSYANELPPHAQVVYTLLEREINSNSPHKRNACAPVLLALVARVARMAHQDLFHTQRALSQEIKKYLGELQMAFLSLLADPKSKQLARESCCIGLTACHGFSIATSTTTNMNTSDETRKLNERLLRAFGQTSKHGGSAMIESRNQQAQRMRQNNNQGQEAAASLMEDFGIETEVGGTAGMGEAALGAYREMANAAITLDRPDILYSLMLLSVSLPVWSMSTFRGKYNASSLLGIQEGTTEKTDEIKKALRPYLKNLIPRLLRACNDPNKQTREQMEALWIGLTGGGSDARALVNNHLLSTIDTLMDDATNKLWRARVGACSALAEVIVGRTWKDLGDGGPFILDDYPIKKPETAAQRLLLLYKVTIRALDDVRLTVRESGESLSRSVRSLTIRLCDSSTSDGDEISFYADGEGRASSIAAVTTILPWLVKYGLNSPCQEAVGFVVSCLLGIVEVANPKTLEPVLPELIGSLLMAMSGLEPAALNYLQTRAAGQDSNRFEQLERIRLQMAQAGPISGALTKCLEMVKSIDSNARKSAIIPHIDSALRCGAGFATRAAAADAVSTLCSQCPLAFKFTGTSTSNPTVRLLRALYFASEREQGTGARDKMIHAFGNLAALAPGTSVRSIALRLCERYKLATGSNDDPAARVATAAALRAISVRASNQFGDGGSNDIWMKRVLPIAFVGRKDREAGSLFEEVWDEGGQVANLSESGPFAMQLQEKILPHLTKSLIGALNDVSWDRRVMACSSLNELCKVNILAPAPRSLNQDSYAQEDLRQRDLTRANSSQSILSTCVKLIVNSRVWTGKSDLVKTTATIAGNWVPRSFKEISTGNENLQFNPISQNNFVWDDLFIKDSWFQKIHDDNMNQQGNLTKEDLVASSLNEDEDMSDEVDIDFNEGDKILGDENDDDFEMVDASTVLTVTYSGLCRVLLEQGIKSSPQIKNGTFYSIDALAYRAASLHALSQLLQSSENAAYLNKIYDKIAPSLISVITGNGDVFPHHGHQNLVDDKLPPLIVAGAISCLGSLIWKGIEYNGESNYTNIQLLVKLFLKNCGETQAAWTIREASAIAASKLIIFANWSTLRKIDVLDDLLACSESSWKDKKFWKVRFAKLKILSSLCGRAGTRASVRGSDSNEKQLMLEALLPLKEKMVNIAKSNLTDAESKVTAISSEIIAAMAWWP